MGDNIAKKEAKSVLRERPKRKSYKEKANSNRPIGPYKAVRYLT